jgi:imidazole glycerol-phosphate synthase subunit HisF
MKQKLPYYFEATDKIFEFAKELRHSQTSSEKYLWQILRNRKIDGLKFRRQHPLGKFVVDFYCHEAKLVIELDGNVHDNPEVKTYDIERQKTIEQLGLTVLRFTNDAIFNDLDGVVHQIIDCIKKNK